MDRSMVYTRPVVKTVILGSPCVHDLLLCVPRMLAPQITMRIEPFTHFFVRNQCNKNQSDFASCQSGSPFSTLIRGMVVYLAMTILNSSQDICPSPSGSAWCIMASTLRFAKERSIFTKEFLTERNETIATAREAQDTEAFATYKPDVVEVEKPILIPVHLVEQYLHFAPIRLPSRPLAVHHDSFFFHYFHSYWLLFLLILLFVWRAVRPSENIFSNLWNLCLLRRSLAFLRLGSLACPGQHENVNTLLNIVFVPSLRSKMEWGHALLVLEHDISSTNLHQSSDTVDLHIPHTRVQERSACLRRDLIQVEVPRLDDIFVIMNDFHELRLIDIAFLQGQELHKLPEDSLGPLRL
mmetsp:Transcript_6128/g.12157  ORF Transcript_6128/g.12157 Transcript_6128/m.12157 type:complete len:353 (-) Transcript_6128:711-1769(-)